MKKYKTTLWCIIAGIFFAWIMYFYSSNRIIILWHKNSFVQKEINKALQGNYQGIWIDPKTEINSNIPIHIPQESIYNGINQDQLLNIFLQSYFHHINIEYSKKYSFTFKHAIIYNQNIIIQGYYNNKVKLEILDEYFFLKSIFLSLKLIIPNLKLIILYHNDKLLELEHLLPFFSHHMLIEYDKIKNNHTIQNEENNHHTTKIHIAYLSEKLGNKIDNHYEKNIYQLSTYKNKFTILTKDILEKNNNMINQAFEKGRNNIVYYTEFIQNQLSKLYVFYYPFLSSSDDTIIESVTAIPSLKINNVDIENISLLKKHFPHAIFCIAPLKIFFNTVYSQFFLLHYIESFENIKHILDSTLSI